MAIPASGFQLPKGRILNIPDAQTVVLPYRDRILVLSGLDSVPPPPPGAPVQQPRRRQYALDGHHAESHTAGRRVSCRSGTAKSGCRNLAGFIESVLVGRSSLRLRSQLVYTGTISWADPQRRCRWSSHRAPPSNVCLRKHDLGCNAARDATGRILDWFQKSETAEEGRARGSTFRDTSKVRDVEQRIQKPSNTTPKYRSSIAPRQFRNFRRAGKADVESNCLLIRATSRGS
jgi:hypothetical protein